MSEQLFMVRLKKIHCSDVLTAQAWLVPHETAAALAHSAYTIQPCHFMQSHMYKVYAFLPVTCHLHFWQNNQDLLHATWGNMGAEQIVDPGEGNSCAAPAGI